MYELYKPIALEEDLDPETKAIRIKLVVQKVNPKIETINLSKQPASVINQIKLIMKNNNNVMLPIREGLMNGFSFISLLKDPIIEMPNIGYSSNVDTATGEILSFDVKESSKPETLLPDTENNTFRSSKPGKPFVSSS